MNRILYLVYWYLKLIKSCFVLEGKKKTSNRYSYVDHGHAKCIFIWTFKILTRHIKSNLFCEFEIYSIVSIATFFLHKFSCSGIRFWWIIFMNSMPEYGTAQNEWFNHFELVIFKKLKILSVKTIWMSENILNWRFDVFFL